MYISQSAAPEPRPQDQETLRSLASAYLVYGMPAKALMILRLATWLDCADTRTTLLLAYAAFRADDHANGVAAVDKLKAGQITIPQDLARLYRQHTQDQ